MPPPTPVMTANHMKPITSMPLRDATREPDTANTTAARFEELDQPKQALGIDHDKFSWMNVALMCTSSCTNGASVQRKA